jgi:L-lactate utilization protein LutC
LIVTQRPETASLDALVATFHEKSSPLGVEVRRAPASIAAAGLLADMLAEWGQIGCLTSAELVDRAPALVRAIGQQDINVAISTGPESAVDAPVGLVLGWNAVAETGSVLLAEPSLEDRSVGLLSKTCIQIVETSTLLPRLEDVAVVLRALALQPNGAYASLVSGPSRTADIELSLTVGVQGPERVGVVFVDHLT